MTEAHELAAQMHQAYERGDHRTARQRARQLLAAAEPRAAAFAGASGEESRSSTDPELVAAAGAVLRRTQPDAFLMIVGALGLGVTAWLFYAYVL